MVNDPEVTGHLIAAGVADSSSSVVVLSRSVGLVALVLRTRDERPSRFYVDEVGRVYRFPTAATTADHFERLMPTVISRAGLRVDEGDR